jgi:hypothetical protein
LPQFSGFVPGLKTIIVVVVVILLAIIVLTLEAFQLTKMVRSYSQVCVSLLAAFWSFTDDYPMWVPRLGGSVSFRFASPLKTS